MRKAVVPMLVVLGTTLVAGCSWVGDLWGDSPSPQPDTSRTERLTQLGRDTASCQDKRNAGQSTTHVQYAVCINGAFQAAMSDISYPHPDIVASLSAERLHVADQLDQGTISQAEGLARIADKISELSRLERARSNAPGNHTDATPPQYFLQIMQVGV